MRNVSAITHIEGENFRILSLQQVFLFEEKEIRFSAKAMRIFLEPLLEEEGFDESHLKAIEWEIKSSGLKLFEMPKREFLMLNFHNKIKKRYSVYFHKVKPAIFAFLLCPLSKADMDYIESNSEGPFIIDEDYIKERLKKKKKTATLH